MAFRHTQIERLISGSALCLLLLTAMGYLVGQTTTGSVSGKVLDSSGAAIPNITIQLRNTATGGVRSGVSNASGDYVFPDVATGTYEIEANAPGFKRTFEGQLRSTSIRMCGSTSRWRLGR
jgi:hypothetical protein